MKLIIFSLLFIFSVWARFNPSLFNQANVEQSNLQTESGVNSVEHVFTQILDHYNYNSQDTWNQRYWVDQQYFNNQKGPVFLYICGEWTCSGNAGGWVNHLAQKYEGLILILEHRYYGSSLPFGKESFSVKNMELLTSEQALKDLAYFIGTVSLNKMFSLSKNPWICVGGSYPGALSAWFRSKYPHLTIGAISSSGVILALESFPNFDQQIYLASHLSGNQCVNALNASTAQVQAILDSPQSESFKAQFKGGQKLTNDEFLFFWADGIVMSIQYGTRQKLCNSLIGKSDEQKFNLLVSNCLNHPVYEYGSYYQKNQHPADANARAWYFQSCTEFGYWQTPSFNHPMRSQRLNQSFYKKYCAESYGEGTWPKVNRRNNQFGGLNIEATNLMMANGVEDPWRWASLPPRQKSIISRVANCTNCAHCVDLKAPSESDDKGLTALRQEQSDQVARWISNYWADLSQHQ